MNIYVESNFVLELALRQEQYDSCVRILELSESGKARLLIPAFSVAEPYETIGRRKRSRRELKQRLETEFIQLARTSTYSDEIAALQDKALSLLVRSTDEEHRGLHEALSRILRIAEVLPLDQDTLLAAARYQATFDSPQDALVYASVLEHLRAHSPAPSCFLNKNRRDFDAPNIVRELAVSGCRLLLRFDAAWAYLANQVSQT